MSILSKLLSMVKEVQAAGADKLPANEALIQRPRNRTEFANNAANEDFDVACSSPNKQWSVRYRDLSGKSEGGIKAQDVRLVELVNSVDGTIAHSLKQFVRPKRAVASNLGIYALVDTGTGLELASNVVAVSAEGCEIFRRHYAALVYSIGLSSCGRYLVVQTCASKGSPDDNLLELHDLVAKEVKFSIHPKTQWSRKFAFELKSGELKRLWVYVDKLGRFAYSPSGVFTDVNKYLSAQLESDDAGTRVFAVQELLSTVKGTDAAMRALTVLDSVLSATGLEPAWRALAYRLKGQSLELLSQPHGAIAAYELAISIDPKVGAKKRLAVLLKNNT